MHLKRHLVILSNTKTEKVAGTVPLKCSTDDCEIPKPQEVFMSQECLAKNCGRATGIDFAYLLAIPNSRRRDCCQIEGILSHRMFMSTKLMFY